MHLGFKILAVGIVLIGGMATCETASAAKRHYAHAHRHARHYVTSGFGRFDPDNYGVYGGPETGFFAGPSYGRTYGYSYD